LEFADAVRARRMVRSFRREPLDPSFVDELIDLATRAPSAGKSQGWHFAVLEGEQTKVFWDATLSPERRTSFAWPGLLDAPVIVLPFADPQMYLARYAEPDKQRSGLGSSSDDWPAPYWTIDTSFAVMTLLLAATDRGLGSLFFGVFEGESELRARIGAPDHLILLGAIALGWPEVESRAGRSASRPRRTSDVIKRGGWL
jgi:nitroreductase